MVTAVSRTTTDGIDKKKKKKNNNNNKKKKLKKVENKSGAELVCFCEGVRSAGKASAKLAAAFLQAGHGGCESSGFLFFFFFFFFVGEQPTWRR
mmetsp:Transcript_2326/g.4892  ORF Transcript_2326/g.4892 Transcript_2326/m.4892 type:complete len:94 (+) Transcript_2326:99-380(+)